MKRILVPTDFSGNAYSALLYACKLYSKENVHFAILHSFEAELSQLTSRVDVGRSDEMLKTLTDNAEQDGQRLLDQLNVDKGPSNHTYEVIATPQPLLKIINEMISEDVVDLVVVGSKGRTGAEGVLIGSTAINVTEGIEGCPLLIVPNDVHFVIPRKIAFASDFNDFYPISTIKAITRLVRHFGSEIYLAHVGSENELEAHQRENMEKYENDLSEYEHYFRFLERKGNISGTLHDFADDESIDLFSLVYHKHAFLKKIFREPVVNRVGRHTNIPTLVIPFPNK
ncbi:MAG TPA: universal stress protein [Flavobacteriaceae bacterium]|nr:universal stress protein [Flavobacteriaceae bacterium]